jgi:cytochrome c553
MRTSLIQLSIVGATLFFTLSCATTPPTSSSAVMLRHFDNARALSTAVIFGRTADAETAAAALSMEGALPSMPPGSESYYDAFHESVTDMTGVTRRDVLARQAATVALRCGDCHLASGLGPSFEVGRPAEATSLRDHMRVHSWASARMWEGLIGGSDLAWRAGARALSGQPLRAQLYATRVPDEEAASDFTGRIHQLGVRALATSDREERAELLGELWATCSGCHELSGVR